MPKIIHSLPLSYGHLVLSLWCPYFRFDLTVIARLNSFPWTTTEPWENITSGQIIPGGYSTNNGEAPPRGPTPYPFSRTQPVISVGFSVYYWVSCAINKRSFLSGDTHLSRFEALAYVLPHFDVLTHMVIRVSSAFSLLNLRKAYIFQEFAEGLLSICVCWFFQSVHLWKVCWSKTPWVKFYFGLSLHIFQHGSSLSMCATPGACIKAGLNRGFDVRNPYYTFKICHN